MGAPMETVLNTYTSLLEPDTPPDLNSEMSIFLLALDLNGHGSLATWVWEMVTLATQLRGDAYGREILNTYLSLAFRNLGVAKC